LMTGGCRQQRAHISDRSTIEEQDEEQYPPNTKPTFVVSSEAR
jgi:hypothetical protein